MLKLLKSLFREKPEPKISKEVKYSDLKEWISKNIEKAQSELEQGIKLLSVEMNKAIQKAEADLEDLKKAELRNDKIPKRAEQIMEGHRAAYIKRTKDFLYKADIDSYDSVENFLEKINEEIDALGRSNTKSNFVLSEFFSDNTKKISSDIKEIENLITRAKEHLLASKKSEFFELSKMINRMFNAEKKQAEINSLIKKKSEEKDKKKSQIDELRNKLENLKKTREFSHFGELKAQREEIVKDIKAAEDDIIQKFSVLEKGLKSYSRIALDPKLIDSYLSDPVRTLENDTGKKILNILDKIVKNLKEGTIDMKDKKMSKTIEVASMINSDFIDSYLRKITLLKRDRKIKDEKMNKNSVMHDYNEQEYLLSHIEEQHKLLEDDISSLQKSLQSIDMDKFKKQINHEAKLRIGIELSII